LSSITEKSLGCITKGGTTPIREILDYAEPPTRPGLVVMDTPGYDIDSIRTNSSRNASRLKPPRGAVCTD
jgi:altronate dehydratase